MTSDGLTPEFEEVVRTVNANIDRLNERLFTYLDYAVIGIKGGGGGSSSDQQ